MWYRTHLRQATVLGILLTAVLLVVLSIPLGLVLMMGGPEAAITIRIYAVALILDALVFGAAAVLVIGAAVRAARGEIFSLPVVTPICERLFSLPHR